MAESEAVETKRAETITADDDEEVSEEELGALLKAIKFAHGDYTLKQMHREVLGKGGKWLTVDLKRIRKLLKKLGLSGTTDPKGDEKILKLFTVGGESASVLEDETTAAAEHVDPEALRYTWKAVELDVPLERSGKFPYQAIVNFNRETTESPSRKGTGPMRGAEIYKVQIAMGGGPPGAQLPMLLYNKPRTRKTFIHPDNPAFSEIERLVKNSGASGALGAIGGLKSYFWGRIDRTNGVLLLCTSRLAPFQRW